MLEGYEALLGNQWEWEDLNSRVMRYSFEPLRMGMLEKNARINHYIVQM